MKNRLKADYNFYLFLKDEFVINNSPKDDSIEFDSVLDCFINSKKISNYIEQNITDLKLINVVLESTNGFYNHSYLKSLLDNNGFCNKKVKDGLLQVVKVTAKERLSTYEMNAFLFNKFHFLGLEFSSKESFQNSLRILLHEIRNLEVELEKNRYDENYVFFKVLVSSAFEEKINLARFNNLNISDQDYLDILLEEIFLLSNLFMEFFYSKRKSSHFVASLDFIIEKLIELIFKKHELNNRPNYSKILNIMSIMQEYCENQGEINESIKDLRFIIIKYQFVFVKYLLSNDPTFLLQVISNYDKFLDKYLFEFAITKLFDLKVEIDEVYKCLFISLVELEKKHYHDLVVQISKTYEETINALSLYESELGATFINKPLIMSLIKKTIDELNLISYYDVKRVTSVINQFKLKIQEASRLDRIEINPGLSLDVKSTVINIFDEVEWMFMEHYNKIDSRFNRNEVENILNIIDSFNKEGTNLSEKKKIALDHFKSELRKITP